MWVRVFFVAIVGAWSFASSAQTVKRLDQVAPHLKPNSLAAPVQKSAPSQLQPLVAPPPPTGYEVKTPPAKVAEPPIRTGLDDSYGMRLCAVAYGIWDPSGARLGPFPKSGVGDQKAFERCAKEVREEMRELSPVQIALRICSHRGGNAVQTQARFSSKCYAAGVLNPNMGVQIQNCRMTSIAESEVASCMQSVYARANANAQSSNAASGSIRVQSLSGLRR